jgi:hypothetical protein
LKARLAGGEVKEARGKIEIDVEERIKAKGTQEQSNTPTRGTREHTNKDSGTQREWNQTR